MEGDFRSQTNCPLLPGAQLQEIEGNEYRGGVKTKVGPITAQYKGTVTFVEADEALGKMVLNANGRDTRGQGSASATITVTMVGDEGATNVTVNTNLNITGKVAQFGRGALSDVSERLVGQFVDTLAVELASGDSAPISETADDGEPSSGPQQIESPEPEPEPVDLLDLAGGSFVKRLLPVAGMVTAFVLAIVWRRHRRRCV